jgi:hypothetical protein
MSEQPAIDPEMTAKEEPKPSKGAPPKLGLTFVGPAVRMRVGDEFKLVVRSLKASNRRPLTSQIGSKRTWVTKLVINRSVSLPKQ